MVIVSFDMTGVDPSKRVRFTNAVTGSGWDKHHKAKTTFFWSGKNPITAIRDFMLLLGEHKLMGRVTHLVVHMTRD